MHSQPDDFPDSVLANLRSRVANFEVQQRMYEDRDEAIAWMRDHYDQAVVAGRITAAFAAAQIANFEQFFSKPQQLTLEEQKAAALFEQFKSRQASRPPDFAALYQRKQELEAARDEGAAEP